MPTTRIFTPAQTQLMMMQDAATHIAQLKELLYTRAYGMEKGDLTAAEHALRDITAAVAAMQKELRKVGARK